MAENNFVKVLIPNFFRLSGLGIGHNTGAGAGILAPFLGGTVIIHTFVDSVLDNLS